MAEESVSEREEQVKRILAKVMDKGSLEDRMPRYELEERERWRDVMIAMPYLPVRPSWMIQVIPPYSGAHARFCVRHKDFPETRISIYADFQNALGYMERPYWELYPAADGDTHRCYIDEIDELVREIDKALRAQVREQRKRVTGS